MVNVTLLSQQSWYPKINFGKTLVATETTGPIWKARNSTILFLTSHELMTIMMAFFSPVKAVELAGTAFEAA